MKTMLKCGFTLFLICLFLFNTQISAAQESSRAVYLRRYQNGTQLYDLSQWTEATAEFRRAQEIAENMGDWSQAIYWVILSQLGNSDYGSAIRDMDELERRAPNSIYTRDMVYHRARIYFNLGYFDDAIILFRSYIDSIPGEDRESRERRAASYFWMGECLYTIGQFDEAEKFYNWVIDRFPESPKHEISTYRVDLIKQKKIEAELLALLQWSHEESLKSSEEYQRRIRVYEYTLNVYQRRIVELTHGANLTNQEIMELLPAEPETLTMYQDDEWQPTYESLLEKARRLSNELELLITEYISGGSF